MARCTGRFLSLIKITRPNSSPNTQNKMPISSSLWPSIPPRKLTWERSGSLRLASPLGDSDGWAKAVEVAIRIRETTEAAVLRIRGPTDTTVAIQVSIEEVLRYESVTG